MRLTSKSAPGEQASKILGEIIECEEVDILKGKQFDNVHRQRSSCANRLVSPSPIRRRSDHSRAFDEDEYREVVFPRSSGDRLGCLLLLFSSEILRFFHKSAGIFGCLCPGRITACGCPYFQVEVVLFTSRFRSLRLNIAMLTEQLEDLRESLKSSKDHRDGL